MNAAVHQAISEAVATQEQIRETKRRRDFYARIYRDETSSPEFRLIAAAEADRLDHNLLSISTATTTRRSRTSGRALQKLPSRQAR